MKKQRKLIEPTFTINARLTKQAKIVDLAPAGKDYFYMAVEAAGQVAKHTRSLIERMQDSEWDRGAQVWIIHNGHLAELGRYLPIERYIRAQVAFQDAQELHKKKRKEARPTVASFLDRLMSVKAG